MFDFSEQIEVPVGCIALSEETLEGLDIIHQLAREDNSLSLFELLNRCKTSGGSAMLENWLRYPLIDISRIEQRLDLVEIFVANPEALDKSRELLLKLSVFGDDLRKFKKDSLSLKDLANHRNIYRGELSALADVLQNLHDLEDNNAKGALSKNYVKPLTNYREALGKLTSLIEDNLELPSDARPGTKVQVKHDIDPILLTCETLLVSMRNHAIKEGKSLAEQIQAKISQESVRPRSRKVVLSKHLPGRGVHVMIPSSERYLFEDEHDLLMRKLPDRTKGALAFQTPNLQRSYEEYMQVRQMSQSIRQTCDRAILATAASFAPLIQQIANLLSHLDVITSFALVATELNYKRPSGLVKAGTDSVVSFKMARHPLLEAHFAKLGSSKSVVANNVSLDKKTSRLLIITGVNMGGKSTFIRMVGLIVVMVQIGCFVPCESAECAIFKNILVRIGSSDSLQDGLSSFHAEVQQCIAILDQATSDSLVIIDELGRGTSMYDGYGTAAAFCEQIYRNRALTLFATHFHDLSQLASDWRYKLIKNYKFDATKTEDHDTAHPHAVRNPAAVRIEPNFQIMEGSCNESHGVAIARLVGMPTSVVERAARLAEDLGSLSSPRYNVNGELIEPKEDGGRREMQKLMSEWYSRCSKENLSNAKRIQLMADLLKQNEQLRSHGYYKYLLELVKKEDPESIGNNRRSTSLWDSPIPVPNEDVT